MTWSDVRNIIYVVTTGNGEDEPVQAEPSIEELKSGLLPDHPIFTVEKICNRESIDHEWSLSYSGNLYLKVGFPNGRLKRWKGVNLENASAYTSSNLQAIKYLGEYDAIQYVDSEVIEASIGYTRGIRNLTRLPGVQISRQPSLFDEDDGPIFNATPEEVDRAGEWRVQLDNEGRPSNLSLELGSASDRFVIYSDRGSSARRRMHVIRIFGVTTMRHDEALALLQRISDSVLFEIDLKYRIRCSLARARTVSTRLGGRRINPSTEKAPKVPRRQYQSKPLSLYRYARSALGMPLLQYLAYYQVLEYHFPSFSRRETLERIKNEVRDPTFEPENDAHVARILALAAQSGRGYGSEREQLKATVRGCVSAERLREFFLEDDDRKAHFSDGRAIRDVATVDAGNLKIDILDQVSNRIYDLRCRIVHAKDDGADRLPELILPFSKEADRLIMDIDLVQFLAEKVLVATSSSLHL